jgi:hypothetical protein
MDRKCRKCGEYIPTQIVIEGKRRNLQNRKFCLICSPYGKHNTKPDDPQRESKRRLYSEWDECQKSHLRAKTYLRGLKRKKELVELKGGKCQQCGYGKCLRAMSFHHRDPSQKQFPLTMNLLWSKSWSDILAEVLKCDLLCIRCHTELEEEISRKTQTIYREALASWVFW